MLCCAAQVACGGYHTLAVVKHNLREAEVDAARQGLRQWAKPKMDLTVEIPGDGEQLYQNGAMSALGLPSAMGPQHSLKDPMTAALAAPGPGKGEALLNVVHVSFPRLENNVVVRRDGSSKGELFCPWDTEDSMLLL